MPLVQRISALSSLPPPRSQSHHHRRRQYRHGLTIISLSADTKSSVMILIPAISRPNPFLGLPRPPRYPQPRQIKHNCILSPWLRCSTRNTQSIRLKSTFAIAFKEIPNQNLNAATTEPRWDSGRRLRRRGTT